MKDPPGLTCIPNTTKTHETRTLNCKSSFTRSPTLALPPSGTNASLDSQSPMWVWAEPEVFGVQCSEGT